MILFYNKKTGDIFGSIGGRVHDQSHMGMSISNGLPPEEIGRFIIGWEATDKMEDFEEEVETMKEVGENLFKKVKEKKIMQRTKMKEHNLDKFNYLRKFEGETPEKPEDFMIKNNNLIKK